MVRDPEQVTMGIYYHLPNPDGTRKGRMVPEVRETYKVYPLIEDGSISQGRLEKQNK